MLLEETDKHHHGDLQRNEVCEADNEDALEKHYHENNAQVIITALP